MQAGVSSLPSAAAENPIIHFALSAALLGLPAGEENWVWGLAVRDKVPMTQRFLTVTTALALLSYCVYELLI